MRGIAPQQRLDGVRSEDSQDVSSFALAAGLPEKQGCDRGSGKPDKRKGGRSWRGMERCFVRQPKLRNGTPRVEPGLASGLLSVSRIAGLTAAQTTAKNTGGEVGDGSTVIKELAPDDKKVDPHTWWRGYITGSRP